MKRSKHVALFVGCGIVALTIVVCVILGIQAYHRVEPTLLKWRDSLAFSLGEPYQTEDINEYGKYKGLSQETQQEFMLSFFPESITEDFKDVFYSYSVQIIDVYGFEAYLEFTIEDEELFQKHVDEATEGMVKGTFHFDPAFTEYLRVKRRKYEDSQYPCDLIWMREHTQPEKEGGTYYRFDSADICKILVNEAEHRIIYVAIGVRDGGGTGTDTIHVFFDRFKVTAWDYEAYLQPMREKYFGN